MVEKEKKNACKRIHKKRKSMGRKKVVKSLSARITDEIRSKLHSWYFFVSSVKIRMGRVSSSQRRRKRDLK